MPKRTVERYVATFHSRVVTYIVTKAENYVATLETHVIIKTKLEAVDYVVTLEIYVVTFNYKVCLRNIEKCRDIEHLCRDIVFLMLRQILMRPTVQGR